MQAPSRSLYPIAVLALVLWACRDTAPTSPAVNVAALAVQSAAANPGGGGGAERYVAIGTSISMGWESNGVYDVSQSTAWPALLGFAEDDHTSLPLIASPGCISPIVAPLGNGLRLSGESIAGSTACAPNDAGVTLPAQNVALAAALAADAVQTTPEIAVSGCGGGSGPCYPWFIRVLPPGATELTAALSQQPTILTVELGGNEVLNGTSGLVVPGVTVVPLPFFTAPYDALLDAIGQTHAKVVLVGLPTDGRNLPSLRRGDEIWANRAEFASLHVTVSDDCNGNQNYINVSVKSLNVVFAAAAAAAHGLPNVVYDCADVPGTLDLVLTPNDVAALNTLLGQMTAHIKQQAQARGYAYFSLDELYGLPALKAEPYSIVAQLTSYSPYSSFISLDGVHPSALGHVLLAAAAAQAINRTYGMRAHAAAVPASLRDQIRDLTPPSLMLAKARAVAHAYRGETVPACPMTRSCQVGRLATAR